MVDYYSIRDASEHSYHRFDRDRRFPKFESGGRSLNCFKCGLPGHRASECRKPEIPKVETVQNVPVKCFSCGQPGHKSPDCLNKLKTKTPTEKMVVKAVSITNTKAGRAKTVMGSVGDVECSGRLQGC